MRRAALLLICALALAALAAAPARAAYGLQGFDVTFTDAQGSPQTQAGSHPFALTTSFSLATREDPKLGTIPDGQAKDFFAEQIPGLSGNPKAVPRCSTLDFLSESFEPHGIHTTFEYPECADGTVVGWVDAEIALKPNGPRTEQKFPVFNLEPPPGAVAKLGFWAFTVPVTVELGLDETTYQVRAAATNISQAVTFYGAKLVIWGVPADPAHDTERGICRISGSPLASCPANIGAPRPFLDLPRACSGPLATSYETDSWQEPGSYLPSGRPNLADPRWLTGASLTHDAAVPPNPIGMSGCSEIASPPLFAPQISARPTSSQADSATGLDFDVDIPDEGFDNPKGNAASDIKKAVVALPKGMTINPAQAEGLGACSQAELAREKADSEPGDGCPQSSKIGTIEAESPALEGETLQGALYVAQPYENPFGTLVAFYMVLRDRERGVIVKIPAKVEPDPRTGQLITTVDNLPQQPVSHFHLHFREGGRSPLITPPTCGTYTATALFTPWAAPGSVQETASSFKIDSGPGGPCPPGGTPPFEPGFAAGSANASAGSYSPFSMRLTRPDGDQDLTRFSAKLPPGEIGKLAGIAQCSATDIAAAKAKSGLAEKASPSCPASSEIGHVFGGAGVGGELLYVPGTLYMAGPFNGAPLSVVAIVPAVAGPFDVGNVVTQVALRINPRTAEVEADGAASDPLPHILAGIPLRVKDIQVYADRPGFTLNPTSCVPSFARASIWGGGADVFSSADDSPASRTSPFQAANCASLGFKPTLALALKGGTKRGAHPALRGEYRPRPGDANLSSLVLRLPHSAFLDQAHIRTICTRVQFAAAGGNGAGCPAGAIYGHVTAYTPLLDEPLEGPVILRSSNHNLPDFVAALHGIVDVEAVARIDSVHGGIRARFEETPDAPLSKVVVEMQGAKKGLIVNSTNLCGSPHRALAQMSGHNGKAYTSRPVMGATGCGQASGRSSHRRSGR